MDLSPEARLRLKSFLGRGPVYWFHHVSWRFSTFWRGAVQIGPRNWSDHHSVCPGKPAVDSRRRLSYFRHRSRPKFFFSGADIEGIRDAVDREDKEACVARAEQACELLFSFRSQPPVHFRGRVEWTYSPGENIEWRWDLNRHDYFETLGRAYAYTGETKYAEVFRDLLLDWLEQNPPRTDAPNWMAVLEVAFRLNNWIWAFHYFLNSEAFDERVWPLFLEGLSTHGEHLYNRLEYHVPNNHLLLEAKSLTMLAILFPEFTGASKWRRRGLSTLYRQIRQQFFGDGVHKEQSTHYHRLIADELLEFLVLMENNSLTVPPDIVKLFHRIVEFYSAMTKPDGSPCLFGDSALDDTALRLKSCCAAAVFLRRAELTAATKVDEQALWLLGPDRASSHLSRPNQPLKYSSQGFPEGGYFVMRAGSRDKACYLAADCGPFSYSLVPSHGHADALSFELFAFGRSLLVDPGGLSRGSTGHWRQFFRSTSAHNTLTVDELDQSTLYGLRGVDRPARATLHEWVVHDAFDFLHISHDGYERLPDPLTHSRRIFFVKPCYWVVIDSVEGRGSHDLKLFFHVSPDLEVDLDSTTKTLHCRHPQQPGILIAPLPVPGLDANILTGSKNPLQGWVCFESGRIRPAPVLQLGCRATAPVTFCTILLPEIAGSTSRIEAQPVLIDGEPSGSPDLFAVRIEGTGWADELLLDLQSDRMKRVGRLESDARLVLLRHNETGRLEKMIVRGGTQVLQDGRRLLELPVSSPEFVIVE